MDTGAIGQGEWATEAEGRGEEEWWSAEEDYSAKGEVYWIGDSCDATSTMTQLVR